MAAVLQAADRAVTVRMLGRVDYETAWRAMRDFSTARAPSTLDEIWLLEHPPVYTMGLRGHARASPAIRGIPVVRTDRGGDMTYHGPGQLVVYLLLDLARLGLGVKGLVGLLEQAVIDLLAAYDIAGARLPGAPGVYVDHKKTAALGLRMRRGCSYHGLALNVDMDLAPFAHIDPCGYPGLGVTQLVELGVKPGMESVRRQLLERLLDRLGYNRRSFLSAPPS
jgi:lipoyl(octanoyl) transferase